MRVYADPITEMLAQHGYIPKAGGARQRRRFFQEKQMHWQRENLVAILEARAGTGRAVGLRFYTVPA